MENIEILEVTNPLTDTIQEFVIIDRGNNEFTSMLKADYDKQQAEQSTPMVADE
jgi:hypothetical protein